MYYLIEILTVLPVKPLKKKKKFKYIYHLSCKKGNKKFCGNGHMRGLKLQCNRPLSPQL